MSSTVSSIATVTSAIATATATAAVDGHHKNLYGGLVPSHSANLAGVILFTLAWVYHTVVGVYYKQWWFVSAFFIGCGLETAGYIGRFSSSTDITNENDFLVQIICLTLAPAFIMGGVYYMLAKLITVYGTQYSVLKPMHYSLLFILCDLFSIILQAIGGGMAAVAVQNDKSTSSGTNIMVAGMAVQVVSMVIFIILFAHYMWKVFGKKNEAKQFNPKYEQLRSRRMFKLFPFAITWCVVCVFIRCIYRLIELSEGWTGFLIIHERYFLVLDGLMIFLGILGLSIIHPGFALGRDPIPVQGLHTKKYHNTDSDFEFTNNETQVSTQPSERSTLSDRKDYEA